MYSPSQYRTKEFDLPKKSDVPHLFICGQVVLFLPSKSIYLLLLFFLYCIISLAKTDNMMLNGNTEWWYICLVLDSRGFSLFNMMLDVKFLEMFFTDLKSYPLVLGWWEFSPQETSVRFLSRFLVHQLIW